MTRTLVVGPNGGASFGQGGGAYVALRIAQTLASEADSTVGLVALWGASLGSLSSAFDIKLPIERIKNFFMFSSNSVREPSVNPLFSPYFGAVTLQLLRFVQRVIHKFHPDLIVFNDDSPRFISKLPSDTKTLVYAHFPYACRLRYDIPDSSSSKSIPRRVSDAFVRPFITRLFETECTGVTWLAANSNVTRRYMLPTFRREVSVIYPPIEPTLITRLTRTDLVTSIGAIQPNKRLVEVIDAMRSTPANCKCVLFGHLRDPAYYRTLVQSIRKWGLENRVRIMPDAPKKMVTSFLQQSKIILHTSRFEPFGLSVVEGMAAGAIPLVYAGEDSGPWVDVVGRGEFGFGFKNQEEMSAQITDLIENRSKWADFSTKARERATFFSPHSFSEHLKALIGKDMDFEKH